MGKISNANWFKDTRTQETDLEITDQMMRFFLGEIWMPLIRFSNPETYTVLQEPILTVYVDVTILWWMVGSWFNGRRREHKEEGSEDTEGTAVYR